ncbi:hypothetical protein Hanom_Chr09g00871671 [Helianthus anomalus]
MITNLLSSSSSSSCCCCCCWCWRRNLEPLALLLKIPYLRRSVIPPFAGCTIRYLSPISSLEETICFPFLCFLSNRFCHVMTRVVILDAMC